MLCGVLLLGLLTTTPAPGIAAPPGLSAAVVDDERIAVAVPEPSALAVRYHRTGQYLWIFARLWEIAVPLALLVSGGSAWMRERAQRAGRCWFLTVGFYVMLFVLYVYVMEFPFRFYAGFVRQHAYNLSTQSFARWLGQSLKGLGLELLGGFCFAWVFFLVVRRAPRAWWLIASAIVVPFFAFLTVITPIWIDPLYNEYGPLKDRVLEQKVQALARRAGVSGSRVFEVNKSADTKAANALVTGLFGTKRIVLWDTLLRFNDREVLAVTGHELGHYVLNHVPWSITLSSLLFVVGFFWTDRAGRWLIARYHDRFGFDSLADVAATPLLLILLTLASLALAPIALAYSRYHEHEADRFALELTHMNRSAALAFADLQRENLGVPRRSLFETLWRSSHPSIAERIEFCNRYRPWEREKSNGPR